jgi:hypothetical protein
MLRTAECRKSPDPIAQNPAGFVPKQFLIVTLAIRIRLNFMKTNASHEFESSF